MRDFRCPSCGQHLAFENSLCLSCDTPVGYSLPDQVMLTVEPDGDLIMCANLFVAECNWLVRREPGGPVLCESCRLTRTRPADSDTDAMAAFALAEGAKRRLIAELTELGLPITGRDTDPDYGLAFDLLSSAGGPVTTGHHNGIITLDLAEGDDVHREQLRAEMDEPYRTLLGHFRHEIGHYYFYVLVDPVPELRAQFVEQFGDPDTDYQSALDRHYSSGPPAGWSDEYVSSYATMHPAEDWAETFAHYLHIRDTLDTAAAFGLAPAAGTFDGKLFGPSAFDALIEMWLPLSWSLNMVNRSMGRDDLYPFVLPVAVLEKLRFLHGVLDELGS